MKLSIIFIILIYICSCTKNVKYYPYKYNHSTKLENVYFMIQSIIPSDKNYNRDKRFASQFICKGASEEEVVRVFSISNKCKLEIGDIIFIYPYDRSYSEQVNEKITFGDTIWVASNDSIEKNYRNNIIIYGDIKKFIDKKY